MFNLGYIHHQMQSLGVNLQPKDEGNSHPIYR